MAKIITFGELLLRFSTYSGERLILADEIRMHYGGAEANVAVALARFGHDVAMVSKIPDNPLGAAIERHLRSHNVDISCLIKGGERLGTYFLETGVGERSPQVTYDRKYSSFSQVDLNEFDFEQIFIGADAFHVTGITPALSKNLEKLTLAAIKKAKQHGLLTSFDFNYRAKLWSQDEAAAAIKPMLPYIDLCFCGELDALYLMGIEKADADLSAEEKLTYYYQKIHSMYPNIQFFASTFRTVHSATANDLQGNLFTGGKLYRSGIHQINPIVDRVGGGDAFASGILHGIINQWGPEKTVEFATAASALKHTIHGDCNVFSDEEILAFLESGSGTIVR